MRVGSSAVPNNRAVHRLSNLDPVARVAVCAACGSVRVRLGGKGRWRCNSVEARKQHPAHPLDRVPVRRVSDEAFNRLFTEQGGVCAICSGPPTAFGRLCIDHDHETGQVRGLLCSNCNAGIGLLRDDPKVIDSAAAYLRKFK